MKTLHEWRGVRYLHRHHVVPLDTCGRTTPKKWFGTSRFLNSLHQEMTLGLASRFRFTARGAIVISSTSHRQGGKRRECPYLDDDDLWFWCPLPINNPIQPQRVPILTHPPKIGGLVSRCDIDLDIRAESSSPTSDVFKEATCSATTGAGRDRSCRERSRERSGHHWWPTIVITAHVRKRRVGSSRGCEGGRWLFLASSIRRG